MTIPINQSQIARTTAEWQSLNPTLPLNTIGIEVMPNGYNRYKRGDGVTRWLGLAYIDKVYRQDIPVDAIPTDGSGNPVASNGVYDAIQTAISTALLRAYPVGAIYLSVNSTSPATLFGGSWVQLKDHFLLGAGDTYAAGSAGGAATHTLTTNEMPGHQHELLFPANTTGEYLRYPSIQYYNASGTGNNGSTTQSYGYTKTVGGGGSHNNMPPYLVVYMWRRTA